MSDLFPGFEQRRIPLEGLEINCRLGGAGPPLLLLHGYPQTHACWHRLAPALARSFRVLMPDLPGYGDSGFLEPDEENRRYSKRRLAAVMAAFMSALGHAHFLLVGHDRGARIAYRLALDHPDRVARLALFDILPTIEEWDGFDRVEALATFHWPFLAQPDGLPERLIAADPDFFLRHLLGRWAGDAALIAPAALGEYLRCFRRESVIRATCADYRAGATTDAADDEADRAAGRRIGCPLLLLWSRGRGDLRPAWRRWAVDLQGGAIACGHFLQEEAPEAVLARLLPFLDVPGDVSGDAPGPQEA
jgi:haloacetate dehalogenase